MHWCALGIWQDDNRAGERVAVDSRKKNSADFALWKVRLRNLHTIPSHPYMPKP